ncbi:MAG: small acid-soluble spore protein SspI [Turicibacter sp.]
MLDAIDSGEEKTLPGLGVIFEVLWNGSNETERDSMINRITQCLKPKAM